MRGGSIGQRGIGLRKLGPEVFLGKGKDEGLERLKETRTGGCPFGVGKGG